MELVLEAKENKSLLKKILYVVVTLLPMAIYMVVYMPTFFWVEGLDHGGNFHIIHTAIDDMIPVIEVFIIPYALWLPYLCAGMIAIAIRSRKISRKTSYMLMTGMTLFIIISLVYPNMLELRAAIPDRQNIFLDMIYYLHSIDTPTDVLPSLHVYDALVVAAGMHLAFKEKKGASYRKRYPCIPHRAFHDVHQAAFDHRRNLRDRNVYPCFHHYLPGYQAGEKGRS